jgi:hypothetical protein
MTKYREEEKGYDYDGFTNEQFKERIKDIFDSFESEVNEIRSLMMITYIDDIENIITASKSLDNLSERLY